MSRHDEHMKMRDHFAKVAQAKGNFTNGTDQALVRAVTQPDMEDNQEQKIEHLQKENERLREQQNQLMSDYLNDLDVLGEHALLISKLRKELGEIKKLKEFYFNTSVMYYALLEFYADASIYGQATEYQKYLHPILEDGGEIARQALALVGETHDT